MLIPGAGGGHPTGGLIPGPFFPIQIVTDPLTTAVRGIAFLLSGPPLHGSIIGL